MLISSMATVGGALTVGRNTVGNFIFGRQHAHAWIETIKYGTL